jgi:hypothetical protein
VSAPSSSCRWLQRTHQSWKIALTGYSWILVPGGVILNLTAKGKGYWGLIGVLMTICGCLAMAVSFFAIRCPKCRRSASLWAISHRPIATWYVEMRTWDRCPMCGDPGDGSNPNGKRSRPEVP